MNKNKNTLKPYVVQLPWQLIMAAEHKLGEWLVNTHACAHPTHAYTPFSESLLLVAPKLFGFKRTLYLLQKFKWYLYQCDPQGILQMPAYNHLSYSIQLLKFCFARLILPVCFQNLRFYTLTVGCKIYSWIPLSDFFYVFEALFYPLSIWG